MLQQGRYIADVSYFIGEDVPKITGVCTSELPAGYSFDYINVEVLLTQALAVGGKLVLNSGMEYRALVLPQLNTMRPKVLRKLEKLVRSGVVFLGPAPVKSPSLAGYPDADVEVCALSLKLWGDTTDEIRPYGKGFVCLFVCLLLRHVVSAGV